MARGCGFAALGIFTLIAGLSPQMVIALKSGGFLCLVLCLALLLKAWNAPNRPYKRTELWVLLAPVERPNADIAQRIISTALRDAYLRFAMHAAWMAAIFLSTAIIWAFALSPPATA